MVKILCLFSDKKDLCLSGVKAAFLTNWLNNCVSFLSGVKPVFLQIG